MTDNTVENIENEAVESQEDNSVEATEAVEEVSEEATQEDVADNEQESQEEVTEEKAQDGEWPKKAVNALANAKKQASKLREKNDAMAMELQNLKDMASSQPKFEDPEPNIDEFDGSYDDYNKEYAKWASKQAVSNNQQEQVQQKIETMESQQQQAYVQEREAYVGNKTKEFLQEKPEYTGLVQESLQIPMTPEVEQVFLAINNAPAAFVNLAQEGRLEELSRMPLAMAQAEIIQAQYREPKSAQKEKPISAAPKPIQSAKGTASSNKPLHQRSSDELLKWVNN